MISPDTDAQSVARLAACFQVLAVAGAVDADCAARLRPHGLSESRFLLLFLLLRHPDGLPPGRMAAQAGVTAATMTSLLDGLEKQRLIRRHHDTADRRGVCVRLTRQGRTLIQGLAQQHAQWIAALFDNFAPAELRQLQRLLRKLACNTGAGDVLPYIEDEQGKGGRMP